jgi:site-specific recombinase XerD
MDKQSIVTTSEFQPVVLMVLNALTSQHSKRAYSTALVNFLGWWDQGGRAPMSKATVQAYRAELERSGASSSTINQALSAIRKLAAEAADNGLLDPVLAGGIARVHGAKHAGVRTGNWLTKSQAQDLINAPDVSKLKGLRDRAILCVQVGAGLRRSEVAALTFEHVQQRDAR